MSTATSLGDVLPPEALADSGAAEPLAGLASSAEAVVHPRSTEEVAETLRWASAHRVGVLPVGSGARAAQVGPKGRFVVLTTDRLTGLEIYEPADVTFTAKAGTRLGTIRDVLVEHGQWLPFDPPHVSERTLGGLVATGESGPVATGYGELRSHVLGATVVCGDGRVLRLGGRVVKNVAGFDLLRPVVGSRGRLGVITSVCVRAFPVPAEDCLLVFRTERVPELSAVARSVRTAPILPASVVIWSPATTAEGAALLVRLHGARPTVEAEQTILERHAGVTFERPEDATALVDTVRDQGGGGALTVRLSCLPSRLFDVLAAARERLGSLSVVADAYGGSARLAPDSANAEALDRLRADVEVLGGALSVESLDPRLAATSSRPNEAERGIAARLARVFDPDEVFTS